MTPSEKEPTSISHKGSTLTRSERKLAPTFHNRKTSTATVMNKYTHEPLITRKKDMKSSNAVANMINTTQTASSPTITAVIQTATFIHNSPFKETSVMSSVGPNDTDYLANNSHHNTTNSFTHPVRVITSAKGWDNSKTIDRTSSTFIPTRTRNSIHQTSTKTKEDFSGIHSNLSMSKTRMPNDSDINSTWISKADHISIDNNSKAKQTNISKASTSKSFSKMDKAPLTDARDFFTGSETTETYTKATITHISRDTKMLKETKNYSSSGITTTISSTTTATISMTTIIAATKDDSSVYTPNSTYRYHTLSWLTGDFTFSAPTSTAITTSSTILAAEPSSIDVSPEYIAPNIGVIIPKASSFVIIKFTQPSYSQMVQDDLLTAKFVQYLPLLISDSLNISPDNIIVSTISYLLDQDSGLVVSLVIPNNQVSNLQNLISDHNSILYSGNNSQLASLIDPSYFVSSNQSFDHSEAASSTNGSSHGLSKSVLIAVCISVGAFIYTVVAVIAYKVYKKQKIIKQAANPTIQVQWISEPIMQDDSLERSINSQPPYPTSSR